MTEKQKIEFLLNLLRKEEVSLTVEGASALLQSYRWLIDKSKELDEVKEVDDANL